MRTVFLGSGGRLGRLLQPIYPDPAKWLTRADVDLEDKEALRTALHGADAVFCLAGVTNNSQQPMVMNTTLAKAVLDAAAAVGAGPVFLFSSAAVYGNSESLLEEQGPATPVSPYGQAKLEMEGMAANHTHPNTALRLGNVAGADAILGNWKPGFTLDTFSDGSTPARSFVGPNTLARVLSDLAKAENLPFVINVAAPGTVQMGALLDAAGLIWQSRPATASTIANVSLDTTALERITSFTPDDSTPKGIVSDWQRATTTE